jgi:pheromone shutdown protein TraB
MPNYDQEQREMEAMQRDMKLGLALQVTGGTLLAFDLIIIFFVWSGLRVGSNFWLYWAIIQGVLGAALVAAGGYYRSKAGSEISRSQRAGTRAA